MTKCDDNWEPTEQFLQVQMFRCNICDANIGTHTLVLEDKQHKVYCCDCLFKKHGFKEIK